MRAWAPSTALPPCSPTGGRGLVQGEGLLDQGSHVPGGGGAQRPGSRAVLIGVDAGCRAAGRAVRGEPTAAGGRGERGGSDVAAATVEHHGRSGPAGGLEDVLGPAGLGVVDDALSAPLPKQVQCAVAPGQWQEQDAHSPGGCFGQDSLTG